MNCKPGDLAVRVKSDDGDMLPLGAVVRCVEYFDGMVMLRGKCTLWAGWLVEYRGVLKDGDGVHWAAIDDHLRPIRDPGDDAQDETLQWLPVPSTVKEAA